MGKNKEQQQRNKCQQNSEQDNRRLSNIKVKTKRRKRARKNADQQKINKKQPRRKRKIICKQRILPDGENPNDGKNIRHLLKIRSAKQIQ